MARWVTRFALGRRLILAAVGCLVVAVSPCDVLSRVIRVEVNTREVVAGGDPFGDAGVYERLVGRIYFTFDPEATQNQGIVDLSLAPLNSEGQVEAWTDFVVLQPVDPGLRRGTAWIEVSNRGGMVSLRYFQNAVRGTREEFGDGLLMRNGLTLIWLGWQQDLPERPGLLRLRGPTARGSSSSILGLVRADWTVDEPTQVLSLGHRGTKPYSVSDVGDRANVLTVRDGRESSPAVIERNRWGFVEEAGQTAAAAGGPNAITLDGGFSPGKIYELVYRGKDPWVTGLGLAAIRDVASYAKYDLASEFPVQKAVAFGVSQTGRFLRHFLYGGFNTDEAGQKVYDGMLIHSAGAGRGSFNHRFAQPSRDAHPYSAFFYPTDLYPFTSRPQEDGQAGLREGLLDGTQEEHRPFVFYTNSGYEYWGRAASLIHTSADGTEDVEPLETERIYHLSGGQHSPGSFPPAPEERLGTGELYRGNPVDFLVTLRALALRMVEWVAEGSEPPPSQFPRIAKGSLVPVGGLAFPPIPGVVQPKVAHVAYRANYGPRWPQGIIDQQPPFLGPPFRTLVPQVDGLGNELAGVRPLELLVPVATYTPWSLRTDASGGAGELTDFRGTYAPLPASEEARAEIRDPRPSLSALYGSKEIYLKQARAAARGLILDGVLLSEDLPRVLSRAATHWDRVMALPGVN